MSKTKNKKKIKLPLAIVGGVVGVGLLVVICFLAAPRLFKTSANPVVAQPTDGINYSPPTEEQQKATEIQKDEIIKQSGNSVQSTGEPQQPSSNFTIAISRAGQAGNGQPIAVRILVTGVSAGTCVFTFAKNGQPNLIKTGDIAYEATSSSCKVDVLADEFSQSGDWKLSVRGLSGDKQASAPDQTVMVVK